MLGGLVFVSCPLPVYQHKGIYETNSSKGGQQRADPRGWTFERNKNVGFG